MKRTMAILILSFTMTVVIFPFFSATEEWNENVKTNIAAQTKSMNMKDNLYVDTTKAKNKNNTSVKLQQWFEGYTTERVNVRKEPSLDADIWEVYDFNTCVFCEPYNEEWMLVLFYQCGLETMPAYISSKYITDIPYQVINYNIPNNNGFKSYMPYDTITLKSSNQYILQSQYAYTGNYGIRQVNSRYCVAVGTAFNVSVGTYFDLILENGTVIQCIVGDIKADADTEENNIVTVKNGCVAEFIVDDNALNSKAKISGDISDCNEEWKSKAVAIRVYSKNIL